MRNPCSHASGSSLLLTLGWFWCIWSYTTWWMRTQTSNTFAGKRKFASLSTITGRTYYLTKSVSDFHSICHFSYWPHLQTLFTNTWPCLQIIESPTWNNTVASVLSVQNHIFLSGVETKGASGKSRSVVRWAPRFYCCNYLTWFFYWCRLGWWTLIEKAPPDRNRSK